MRLNVYHFFIAVDEFATRKEHRYLTVVMDLESGAIVHDPDHIVALANLAIDKTRPKMVRKPEVYLLKEQLRHFWDQPSKEVGFAVLEHFT